MAENLLVSAVAMGTRNFVAASPLRAAKISGSHTARQLGSRTQSHVRTLGESFFF